jgi:hypothetical protein
VTTTELSHFIRLKNENDPIVIESWKIQKLYYGNSALLNKLKYPVSLLLIMFSALVYYFTAAQK